ncbi:YEATS domain-containing protein 2 [Aplysia californica]|uniref:YEATS domain-containing protein 2 n=1 Tax=Aplysia californica TaxID=6500 RepID=A0ABM1A1E7_APLCA|nr:YEATS domain-containing protein 2 [Aplysia californica]
MRTSVDDRLLPVDESSPLLCSLSSPLPDNPVASSSSATNHAQVPTHPTNRAQVPTSSDDCVPTTETSVSSACVRSACVSSVACGGEREPGLANEEGGTLWGTKVAGTSSSLPQLSAPGRAKVVPGRQVSLLTGRVISPVAPRGDSGLTSAAPRASSGQTAAHRAARGRHTTQALNNVLGTIQHGGRQLLLVANTAAHTQRVNQTPTSLHPHTPPHLADSLPNSSSVPALRSQASTPLATVSTKPGTVTILQSFPQSVSQAAPIPPRSTCVALADSPRVVAVQQTSLVHARLTESAAAQSLLSNPASLAVSPSFEKMSAVGVTKHGKGVRAVPGVAINRSLRTDEERRLGQYEILNAWKNNPEKFSRVPSKSRKVCRSTDVIDGDVDHLPSLHLPDYLDVQSLTRAAVKLHPLLRPGVNRLTHPYCAESPDQWSSWPVGKQRAAEWHRACFTLRYLRECLGGRPHYQGEPLLSTRQLVVWCRRHGFSPCLTQATRGDTEATRGDTEEGVEGVVEGRVSQLLPPTLALSSQLLPPTFTLSSTLEKELRVTDRRTNDSQGGGDDQEIVDITEFTVETGLTARRGAAGGEHGQVTGSCESLSHGARFVTDLLRKRGLKLGPVELEAGLVTLTSADMIYRVAVEFAADLLREAAGVSATRFSRVLSVEDVHSALSSLPTAAFCRSSYLGKEADSDGISR